MKIAKLVTQKQIGEYLMKGGVSITIIASFVIMIFGPYGPYNFMLFDQLPGQALMAFIVGLAILIVGYLLYDETRKILSENKTFLSST